MNLPFRYVLSGQTRPLRCTSSQPAFGSEATPPGPSDSVLSRVQAKSFLAHRHSLTPQLLMTERRSWGHTGQQNDFGEPNQHDLYSQCGGDSEKTAPGEDTQLSIVGNLGIILEPSCQGRGEIHRTGIMQVEQLAIRAEHIQLLSQREFYSSLPLAQSLTSFLCNLLVPLYKTPFLVFGFCLISHIKAHTHQHKFRKKYSKCIYF